MINLDCLKEDSEKLSKESTLPSINLSIIEYCFWFNIVEGTCLISLHSCPTVGLSLPNCCGGGGGGRSSKSQFCSL